MRKLKFLAAVLFAALALSSCAEKKIGIQLYSVHRDMKDVELGLQKVADAGYKVVETLGSPECFGLPAADFKALCDAKGLEIVSTHLRIDREVPDAMDRWKAAFEGLKTMGAKYCVIPSFNLGKDINELKEVCNYFNEVGKLASQYGLKLGYHNHSFEYEMFDDIVKWEYMIENTDPEYVFFQMDVYWTTRGGKDPVEYLKKYPNRIQMLHIKDDLVIGESGKIDFEAIFKQFYKNGYKDYVVEQEMPKVKDVSNEERVALMWEGVAISAEYLRNAKFVK